MKNRKNVDYIYSCLSPTFTALFGIIGSKITGQIHFNWVQDIWPEAIISSTNTKKFCLQNNEIFQNFLLNNSELIAQSDKMSFFLKIDMKKN